MGVNSREDDFHGMNSFFDKILLQFSGVIDYEDSSLKSTEPARILSPNLLCVVELLLTPSVSYFSSGK